MSGNTAARKSSVLLTGASGFIGRHVIDALFKRGHTVFAMQGRKELPEASQEKCQQVFSGDICKLNIPSEIFNSIDVVCHLAAYIPNNFEDYNEAEKCFKINALAVLSLTRAAADAGVKRIVYTSTGNIYNTLPKPALESEPAYPSKTATYYLTSKLAGELYLSHFCKQAEMNAIVLRIGTAYGPGEPDQKVIPTFMKLAKNEETLNVLYGGKPKYNFVYIEDVARCIVKAIDSGRPGIYNIASNEHTSLRQLAETVSRVYNDRDVSISIRSASNVVPAGFPPMSIEKACNEFDFSPLSLLDGLTKYRAFMDEAG